MGRIYLLLGSLVLVVITTVGIAAVPHGLGSAGAVFVALPACAALIAVILGSALTAREEVLDRLEVIDNRLKKLEEKLAPPEGSGAAAEGDQHRKA